MSYLKAADILPKDLLDLVQDYVDGEYIYIPRKECNKKSWGEITKSRYKTYARNLEIIQKYARGISVKDLSSMYFLSPKTIYKIISSKDSNG